MRSPKRHHYREWERGKKENQIKLNLRTLYKRKYIFFLWNFVHEVKIFRSHTTCVNIIFEHPPYTLYTRILTKIYISLICSGKIKKIFVSIYTYGRKTTTKKNLSQDTHIYFVRTLYYIEPFSSPKHNMVYAYLNIKKEKLFLPFFLFPCKFSIYAKCVCDCVYNVHLCIGYIYHILCGKSEKPNGCRYNM